MAYRIAVGTRRDWEQRRKFPDAPARAYLMVIEKNPKAVAAMPSYFFAKSQSVTGGMVAWVWWRSFQAPPR